MLCDMGFSVGPGQSATFRDVTVRHNRVPNNILFREDLAAAAYKGLFADAVTAELGILGGERAVRAVGRRERRLRRAQPEPQLDADAADHVQGVRQGDRRPPASTSPRAASTRCS